MSVDQLIIAYVEIKGEVPPENLTLRDANFYMAVKPSPARVNAVKRSLHECGFTLVDPASGNYCRWDNRIVIQGSKQRFNDVFGIEVVENKNRYASAPTHFCRGPLDIRHDNFLAQNVSNVLFPSISEVEPVTQRRRVRHLRMAAF